MVARLRYDAAPERRRWILDQLHVSGFLSVPQLAEQLDVSDMTVRRDLRRLEADGEVLLVHGGVRLPHAHLRSTEFVTRSRVRAEAKEQIARHVAATLPQDAVIAIDAGTTTYPIAHALPSSYGGAIVTPSVPVIHALLGRPEVRVVGLGGDLHQTSQAFVGPLAVEAARRLRVRTFFLAASAVDARGVYVEADAERPTKLALMDTADEVVLLADHGKFERTAPVQLCPLERVDRLVTDASTPAEQLRSFTDSGVLVEVADSAPAQR